MTFPPPRRLIESVFPLKQASLDSVHEKSVRHGHISTLHIWPARRPLAASRAALLATLLPDPEDGPEKRQEQRELLRQMAGRVVDKTDRDGEVTGETTEGGILHWGRESASKPRHTSSARARDDKRPNDAPGNAAAHFHPLARFRKKIADAFNGRPPRVLDPFAGGAIPLEAMRLGCEVVASDLNPVAWFILRCTLHYPHLLAGRKRALPDFALDDEAFMSAFFKAQGVAGQRALREALDAVGNCGGGKSASRSGGAGLLPMKVDAEADAPTAAGSGGRTRLKPWHRRTAKDLGERTADGTAPPLVDCVHRLMRLWKTGEQSRVDGYLEAQGLRRNDLFRQVVQAVLELAKPGTDERATLEYIQNHLAADGGPVVARQRGLLEE